MKTHELPKTHASGVAASGSEENFPCVEGN